MKKKRADEIFGQGLIVSLFIGLVSALAIFLMQDVYFSINGVSGEIRDQACIYRSTRAICTEF